MMANSIFRDTFRSLTDRIRIGRPFGPSEWLAPDPRDTGSHAFDAPFPPTGAPVVLPAAPAEPAPAGLQAGAVPSPGDAAPLIASPAASNDQPSAAVPAPAEKPTVKKTTAKSTTAKKTTAQSTKARKTAARSTAAKPATAGAPAAESTATSAAGTTAGGEAAASEDSAKRPTAGKTTAKKTTAKKTAARKTTTRKTTTPNTTAAKKAAGLDGADQPAAGSAQVTSPDAQDVPIVQAAATGHSVALPVRDGEVAWTQDEIASVREELMAERDQLLKEIADADAQLAEMLRDAGDGSVDDQADAGSRTFEREQEISLAADATETLAQVDSALRLLENGGYGVCERCGQPIGKLRLQAYPRATMCLACKEQEERR